MPNAKCQMLNVECRIDEYRMSKNRYEIHDRIYRFVLCVLDGVKEIPRTPENLILLKQVVRSSGSIGANSSEADAAESKKEFIHRFVIAKKEAQETQYWLSLLVDHNKQNKNLSKTLFPLTEEIRELLAIISSIIINSQKNSQR